MTYPPIEKQVSSLDLSELLERLGCPQDSLWYWCSKDASSGCFEDWQLRDKGTADNHTRECYSAYTVSELAESLPRAINCKVASVEKSDSGYRELVLSVGKTIIHGGGWYALYSDPHLANKTPVYTQYDETLANTLAKMRVYLIYLLENGLIKAEDL